MFHVDVVGFQRQRVFMHRDQLGEAADARVGRTCINLIAGFETAHGGTHLDHHAGQVIAQYQRECIRQDQLELARSDLRIQHVDAGGAHLDQYVMVAHLRRGNLADASVVFAVTVDQKCLHGDSTLSAPK